MNSQYAGTEGSSTPARALVRGMRYLAWYTQTLLTSATALSSSSSGVYASPSTLTLSPGFTVPDRMRPKASAGARAFVSGARERRADAHTPDSSARKRKEQHAHHT